MDVHVPRAVTIALRLRFVDVMTSQEDSTSELDDDKLLDRATELSRVLVSQDEDLLFEGARRQLESRNFAGMFTHTNVGSRSAG
jgi:predicted nuclease of predicted toxin-antitoxin system